LVGDPVYAWHPVRLIGRSLTTIENALRAMRADGYTGGVVLFVALSAISLTVTTLVIAGANLVSTPVAWIVHAFMVYSFLALGDLVHHVLRIERAVRAGDLDRARSAVRMLVGRDTNRMDGAACRRAAVESLSENFTDGFVSPVFWYVLAGLPGLVVFKVVSTMDSMVGYRTPEYQRFGWCGARLDDAMNYAPARVTWLLIAGVALMLPGFSGRKAWTVGIEQHALLPGPNAGWSEAATAGAIGRRLVGPIWREDAIVTDLWLGAGTDPPLAVAGDVTRALALVVITGVVVALAGGLVLSGLPLE
jgi:adenosylcobinamide-phosphate synthase